MAFSVEVHDAPFEHLAEEWQELHDADPEATPYSSPDWARTWWRHLGDGARAVVCAVREGGRLAGLAAFVVRRQGPVRVLCPLGKEPADYWDVLARPEVRRPVAAAVADELVRQGGAWDVLRLCALREGSPTQEVFERALRHRLTRDPIPCPGLELPATWNEYLARLPSKRRTHMRRSLRRLDGGEIILRELREPEEIRDAVERWHRMRARQWDAMGKALDPAHERPAFREFIADMAVALAPAGRSLVWEMRHEGKPAAYCINLADDRAFYWYLSAFEPELSQLALGRVAIAHAIRSSIEAGRRYFDFTVGDEEYKYRYGATDRHTPSIVAASPLLRARAILLAIAIRARVQGHA